MSSVLVIGGLGFIGHHLVNQLYRDGHDLTIVDNNAPYTDPEIYTQRESCIPQLPIIRKNITDVEVSDISVLQDTVVHLGSYPNIKEIERSPDLGIASLTHGVFHSLTLARQLEAKRFVYSSSSMVYGDFKQNPCTENHPRHPSSIYGIYKKAAEDLVIAKCKEYNIEYTIIRPIAVYGPGDNKKRVVSKFFDLAIQNKKLPVRGDTILDATYVLDVVQGFTRAVQNSNSNVVLNISAGTGVSIRSIAQEIIHIVGAGSIDLQEPDPIYPVRGALDITCAKKAIGYYPRYSLQDGLNDMFDKFR